MPLPHQAIAVHFRKLHDPRIKRHRRHLLLDVIVLAICAVLANCDSWQDIELFGKCRIDWLRKFLKLPNGIPSHDTIERVFARLDAKAFQACFGQWVQALSDALDISHVAIDGKTMRSSGRGDMGPLHVVSAWACAQQLTLGQVAVDGKSNEITAIPELLQLLELKGALVTIDAMGCQKAIAAKIIERGGDYVLAVKDNQPTLLCDIQESLAQALDSDFEGLQVDQYSTHEKGHGREEKRHYTILIDPEGISQKDQWQGLKVIGMCCSERIVGDKHSDEIRYFIGSRKADAKTYAKALRGHWGIENNLHWQLDVSFKEDTNRTSQRNAAENLGLVRKLALTLLKAHPAKMSIARKRLGCALSPEFLEETLRQGAKLGKL